MSKPINFLSRFYFHVVYQDFKDKRWKKNIILEDFSSINEYTSKMIQDYTFFDFYQTFYKDSRMVNETAPHFICTGLGSIKQLENLKLTDEQIEHLNKKSLKIFLFENMILSSDKDRSKKFYITDVENDGEKYARNFSIYVSGMENTAEMINNLWSFELESIDVFVRSNNLKNVTVCACDYNIEKTLQSKYSHFKITTEDCYIKSLVSHTDKKTFMMNEYVPSLQLPNSEDIEYKFISLNRRYTGIRNLLVAFLLNKSSLLSFNGKLKLFNYDLQKFLWFNLDSWEEKYPKIYKEISKNLPLLHLREITQDISVSAYDERFNQGTIADIPFDLYKKCFCSIITEGYYARPFALVTEKTLTSIKCFRPFIIIAPPNTLKILKDYGLKTFDRWWDESYDDEINNELRLIKIFELINQLDKLSLSEMKRMYSEMIPILEHNYKMLSSLKN